MRICVLSREYPPDTGWGGIGAYSFQLANALFELGHEVEVVALAEKSVTVEPPVQDGSGSKSTTAGKSQIKVHRAVWGDLLDELATVWISVPYSHYVMKSNIALWNKFIELHTANPFDVVEAPEHLAEGIFVAMTKCCPLVIRLHTPHFKFVDEGYHNLKPSFDQHFVSAMERAAILAADVVSSPSQELAGYVAKRIGMDRREIEIVRNPVDAERFSPDGEKTVAPNGKVTVLFAGRLEERKGVVHLIDAVADVIKSLSNIRFVVVGRDTNTAPGKSSMLKHLKSRLNAQGQESVDAVQFIDHVDLSEMPGLYRSADICVVPSLYDNAPYTVLEAMSCGRPLIGTAVGGTPEYIEHGKTGLIVPPADPAALARAILQLAESEELRTRFGATGRQRALDTFERKTMALKELVTYDLARERFVERCKTAAYRRSPTEVFDDLQEMLFSYHQNLYQLIYVHSIRFRIKHWLSLMVKRPRLCAAKLAAGVLDLADRLMGGRVLKLSELSERLAKEVELKERQRASLSQSSIGVIGAAGKQDVRAPL